MIPLRDVIPSRTTPFVTVTLIGLNVLAFLYEMSLGERALQAFLATYGMVPLRLAPTDVATSMFLHGGLLHLGANMLSLWIFGDNVEDRMGHGRFLTFYLLCGIAAALAQTAINPDSIIPMLGASGAISGVMGGYLVLFPQRQVRAIIFNFLTTVPAFIALGLWIGYQLLLGFMTDPGTGGVAYAAHIGGFVAGVVLIKVFALGRRI